MNLSKDTFSKHAVGNLPRRSVRAHATTLMWWVMVGCLIRVVIMPILASGDLMTTAWISLTLMKNGQFIASNDPPPVFYLFSVFYFLVRPILPSNILEFITSNTAYTPPTHLQLFSLLQPGIQTFLFISKIPFLIFDIASGILLMHLVNDGEKAMTVFKVWILNPVSIFISYAVGQFDIIPTFFLILALYFFKRGKVGWSVASLGLASTFKMFCLLFILPVILIHLKESKNLATKAKKISWLLATAFLPLVFIPVASILTPQYYESLNAALPPSTLYNGFFGRTFYSRGEPSQPLLSGLFIFFLNYSVAFETLPFFSDIIYLTPLAYGVFLLGIIYWRSWSFERLWKVMLMFLLVYYAFTLFHVQWFLWVQPFLSLLVVKERKRFLKLYLVLIPLYFIYTWHWGASLTTALVIPIMPEALSWLGPIEVMKSMSLAAYQIINVFRSLFSAVCIFASLLVFKSEGFIGEKK